MPLYEYKCPKGHTFEKIESYSAPEIQKCPKCGAKAGRVLAPSAIQFKGSGWYVTDYAGKNAGSKSSDGESKPASKEDSGGEKKPAASKETKSKSKKE